MLTRVRPEHGPGAAARNVRQRFGAPHSPVRSLDGARDVEVRDLAVYEQLAELAEAV